MCRAVPIRAVISAVCCAELCCAMLSSVLCCACQVAFSGLCNYTCCWAEYRQQALCRTHVIAGAMQRHVVVLCVVLVNRPNHWTAVTAAPHTPLLCWGLLDFCPITIAAKRHYWALRCCLTSCHRCNARGDLMLSALNLTSHLSYDEVRYTLPGTNTNDKLAEAAGGVVATTAIHSSNGTAAACKHKH